MSAGAPLETAARMTPRGLISMRPQRTCSIPDCNDRRLARDWCSAHYQRWRRHGDPLAGRAPPGGDVAERFWAKVDRSGGPDACWPWMAGRFSSGYGVFVFNRKSVPAHRWAYESEIGPIPEGLELDHLCRNRACQNARHLEPVTHAENVRRGEGLAAQNARKTHCLRGHEFTAENTYLRSGGNRQCRDCKQAHQRARGRARR